MLHAISQKKTNLYRRYLGHRGPEDGRVMEEDEITSLIMTPLTFMSHEAVGEFWRKLLPEECTNEAHVRCEGSKMTFWPSRSANGRRIEPDLLIKLDWMDGQQTVLLVEFKWRAGLSGQEQLHRQWKEFLTCEERKNAFHLFIAPEVSAGVIARTSNDVWGERLVLCSWHKVAKVMYELSRSASGALRDWAHQVQIVLSMLKMVPFSGFGDDLANSQVDLSGLGARATSHPVFWRDMSGFTSLSVPSTEYKTGQPFVFFDQKHGEFA